MCMVGDQPWIGIVATEATSGWREIVFGSGDMMIALHFKAWCYFCTCIHGTHPHPTCKHLFSRQNLAQIRHTIRAPRTGPFPDSIAAIARLVMDCRACAYACVYLSTHASRPPTLISATLSSLAKTDRQSPISHPLALTITPATIMITTTCTLTMTLPSTSPTRLMVPSRRCTFLASSLGGSG